MGGDYDYTMQQVECSCPESWVDSGKDNWIINNDDLFNNDSNECYASLAIAYIKHMPLFGVGYGHISLSSTKSVDAMCRWLVDISAVMMHL